MPYNDDGLPFVDADTSYEAAESMRGRTQQIRNRIVAHLRSGGATCDELELTLGVSHQTCSARLRELVQDGLVVDSKRRRKTRSGRSARVYILKPKEGKQKTFW